MSHYDRGPYAPPSEPPLTIGQRGPTRGGGPAPVTLIISVLLLALAAGGVFFLYRGGVRGSGGVPQPVGTPIRDVKVAAPPQAQTPDPAAGLSIYRDDAGAAARTPAFAAPPEQPVARPVAAPAASPPIRAAPLEATPPVVRPAPPAPAPKPVKAEPVVVATAEPTPAKSGAAMVQIGAYSSASLADRGWSAAAAVAPGDMAGKGKKVEPVVKGGATLYRTSITGFASRQEAKALCDKLQGAGKSCFVK